eukprot:262978_1
MSTHALITILVYLVLNIQNAKSVPNPEFTLSCAAAGSCQGVSVSFNFPPAEFHLFIGSVTSGAAATLMFETLLGIKSEPEPTEVTEPSEPTKPSESDPDPEPEPARRLFTSNCKSDVYVTDCTI